MGLHHHNHHHHHHQDASNNSGLHLVLGLALTSSPEETITSTTTATTTTTTPSPSSNKVVDVEPSLTLGLCGGESNNNNNNNLQQQNKHVVKVVQVPRTKIMDYNNIGHNMNNKVYSEELLDLSAQTSPHSVVSSFSSGRVKRERDLSSEEMEPSEIERVSSRVSDEDDDGAAAAARKKLRLTKEQSALLEESFKQHSTLNPKQKQALARQLNLRPRQVEVWFQNRRARTKLKQTEVDCEFLKKCCETLTDENRRLQKELQELKALKLTHPLYMPMPAATLTMCPSCERLGAAGAAAAAVSGGASNKSPFSLAPKAHHFYNPFTNPSAAC